MCDYAMPGVLAASRWKLSDGRRFKIRVFGAKDANFSMPIWMPPAIFSTYPLWIFFRGPVRRFARCRWGQCLKCGYDLTGNATGVCPECGRELMREIKSGKYV